MNGLKDSAKEKGQAFIDEWLKVLPQLEEMGFEITSFGVAMALSPALEVEMKGKSDDFTDERVAELMEANESNNYVSLVLKSIRTTRSMHRKVHNNEPTADIFLKITVKVPPEIRVYFGKPRLH